MACESSCVSVWGVSCGFLRELVAVLYQMNCRCSDPDVSERLVSRQSLLMNPCCDRVSRCRRFHSRPWWAKGQNPELSFLFSLWIAAHVNHARPLLPYLSLYHTFMAFYNKKVQDWQKLKPFFSISVCVCAQQKLLMARLKVITSLSLILTSHLKVLMSGCQSNPQHPPTLPPL